MGGRKREQKPDTPRSDFPLCAYWSHHQVWHEKSSARYFFKKLLRQWTNKLVVIPLLKNLKAWWPADLHSKVSAFLCYNKWNMEAQSLKKKAVKPRKKTKQWTNVNRWLVLMTETVKCKSTKLILEPRWPKLGKCQLLNIREQQLPPCCSQADFSQMTWQIQDVHYLAINIYHYDERLYTSDWPKAWAPLWI